MRGCIIVVAHLDRHNNTIEDIRGLIHVPKLRRLGLADNNIADLPSAREVVLVLTSLQDLSFQGVVIALCRGCGVLLLMCAWCVCARRQPDL